MKTFKQLLTNGILALVMAIAVVPAFSATSFALDPRGTVCNAVDNNVGCATATGSDLSNVVKAVINILSDILGVVAIIMIIIGGLKYITSAGDASSISSAKNTIIYALVGLVVAALAQFLTHYVLFRVTHP